MGRGRRAPLLDHDLGAVHSRPPMPPRKSAPKATKPRQSNALPEQLPQREVMLACFYRTTVAAHSDRPAELEALLRASLPAALSAPQKRAAARSLLAHIGVVRWSEANQCLWFRQGRGSPYRVHPSRLTEALRALVTTVEPTRPIRDGHGAGDPPPDVRE